MRTTVSLVFSLCLVVTGLSCNRDNSAPPNEKAATASTETKTTSPEDQNSSLQSTLWVASVNNGGLMPVAMYRAGKWSDPWPTPRGPSSQELAAIKETVEKHTKSEKGALPIPNRRALKDIPPAWFGGNAVPDTWHGLSVATGKRFTIHTTGALEVGDVDDGFQWVLEFDQVTPSGVFDGIVLSQHLQIATPAITIEDKSPEWNQISAFLKPVFDQDEDSAIQDRIKNNVVVPDKIRQYSGHPSDLRERITEPSVLKVTKISVDPNGHLYYFDLQRKYSPPDIIGGVSQFTGWLMKSDSNKLSFIDKNLVIDDADQQWLVRVALMCTFQWDGRTFAFLENGYYEGAGVSIMEWDGSHLVMQSSKTLYSK